MNAAREFRRKALSFQFPAIPRITTLKGHAASASLEDATGAAAMVPINQRLHQRMRLAITPTAFVFTALIETAVPEDGENADSVEHNGRDLFTEEVLRIDFATAAVSRPETYDESIEILRQFEVFGLVGFISLFSGHYMVVITEISSVGLIDGMEVFGVDRVAVVPLDADMAIAVLDSVSARRGSMDTVPVALATDAFADTLSPSATADQTPQHPLGATALELPLPRRHSSLPVHRTRPTSDDDDALYDTDDSSVNAQDLEDLARSAVDLVVDKVGGMIEGIKKRTSKMVQDEEAVKGDKGDKDDKAVEDLAAAEVVLPMQLSTHELEVKVIREMASIFESGFYFSYEYDLTTMAAKTKDTSLPLWERVEGEYWWNEGLQSPLIDQQLHSWILPLMQGFVQIERCSMEDQEFDFILISRRSRARAGMRYHRRGINEKGDVANFVETEQMMKVVRNGVQYRASFVQIRGSIPLFWTQSAYRLRPDPVIERGFDDTLAAITKHFDTQIARYGRQVCVSLVEKSGREAIVGQGYKTMVTALDNQNILFREFDFHEECKGMKYENIARLIDMLEEDIAHMQSYWSGPPDNVLCVQNSVFRTNCMDCLDRTNVVQSAFARNVINVQLMRMGVQLHPEVGISKYEDFEVIFNDVWANNGDSISRQYAGTSALKGDFTRTGKRNIQGMVNDATNSIARLYQNAFRDAFRQATIDYMLGNHSLDIFQHVHETNRNVEPGDDDRWSRIRANAVDITAEIVLLDGETRLNGWVLLSPARVNSKRGGPYEERVVLLTRTALYFCTFHYGLEKVVQFNRIPLDTILKLQKGIYVLSTAKPQYTVEEDNYGFLIHYRPEGEDVRFNSGSLRNSKIMLGIMSNLVGGGPSRYQAFKAVPHNLIGLATKWTGMPFKRDDSEPTCRDMVEGIVAEIATAVSNTCELPKDFICDESIMTPEEAQQSDGLLSRIKSPFNKILPFDVQIDRLANPAPM